MALIEGARIAGPGMTIRRASGKHERTATPTTLRNQVAINGQAELATGGQIRMAANNR